MSISRGHLLLLLFSITVTLSNAWSLLDRFKPLVAPTPTKSADKESAPAFRAWCDAVGIKASKLQHSTCFDGIPGITVRQSSSLSAGECGIVLPVDAAIVVLADNRYNGDDCDEPLSVMPTRSPIPDYLSDNAWQDAHQKLRLACLLLSERQKGNASYYKGYVEHLPPVSGPGRERCETLDRWSMEELSLLKSSSLCEKLAERAEMDDGWFKSLQGSAPCSRDEFDWAVDVVRTRAFVGDFSVPNNGQGDDIALLPFVDDLNHRETIGFAKEQGELYTSSSSNTFPPVAEALGRTKTAVCWVAHDIHKAGDEVAHSYLHGAGGIAEDFLHEWGFTPLELGANVMFVHGVKVVIRYDGQVDNESRVLDAIRQQLEKKAQQSQRDICDDELWKSIAEACHAEIEIYQVARERIVDRPPQDMPQHRRAIATSFLDGKRKILQAGYKWTQQQSCKYAVKPENRL